MNKLVLGTVQFGVDYGINNSSGQVPFFEVCDILRIAHQSGIRILDTSSGYGESERVLGKALVNTKLNFNIVSKYPRASMSINEAFNLSLKNLGVEKLYGYLVHHFDFYLEKPSIYDNMKKLKDEGRIEKIGFSIYTEEQLQLLLENDVPFDIIQFPYNMLDRQFEPYMQKMCEHGVEIQTRSAFLQGLFFKETDKLSDKLKPLKPYLDSLHDYCTKRNISIEQLSLGYVVANKYIVGNLIGVDNCNQLESNIKVIDSKLEEEDLAFIRSIEVKEKNILNPINWK